MKYWIITALLVEFCLPPGYAQFTVGRTHPHARQFDFWLGDWEVQWQQKDGQIVGGISSVKSALDGSVIIEYFDGNRETGLKGMSISTFDAASGKWIQTWVDNQGNHFHYSGQYKDGKMILRREVESDGQKTLQRMVYYNISQNAFDWDLETSTDNGKSWLLAWRLHYKRKS